MSVTVELYNQPKTATALSMKASIVNEKKRPASGKALQKNRKKEWTLKINEKPLYGIKRFGRVRLLLLLFALRSPGRPSKYPRVIFCDKYVEITFAKQPLLYDPITNAPLFRVDIAVD